MQIINGDIFTGVLTKNFKTDKGFKGLLELNGGGKIGVSVGYDGKLAETLKDSLMKEITLCGTLQMPKDAKLPFIEVKEVVEGGTVIKRGRVATTPELRYSQSGNQFATFKLAVNHGFGDTKKTYFYSCIIFGNENEKNPAINFVEKIQKGQELIVRARPQFTEKENKVYCNLTVVEYELIYSNKSSKTQATEEEEIEIIEAENDIPF